MRQRRIDDILFVPLAHNRIQEVVCSCSDLEAAVVFWIVDPEVRIGIRVRVRVRIRLGLGLEGVACSRSSPQNCYCALGC